MGHGLIASQIGKNSQALHDGSRTGSRVGYQSYCHPEQGIVIYENEKMVFTTDEGKQVLWTQGDIDCYKKKQLEITTAPTSTPTPIPKKVQPVYVDPDPIINCNIHANCGGGNKKMKKSECDNMTCCTFDIKCGGSKLVTKAECNNSYCCYLRDGTSKLLSSKNACDNYYPNVPSTNTYTPPSYPSCTVYYPILGYSQTYTNTSPGTCKIWQDQASAGSKTYTAPTAQPTPTLTESQAQALIDQHNGQVKDCQYAVIDRYGDDTRISVNCNNQFGFSSATEACITINSQNRQKAYNACGAIY